eukprot:GFUD01045641.1.p1 GENE.GFUD01045641.1~~GFUD01045641.1.p1  ORF type:complete len:476 (-),score=149.67 GFUD01045641.1:139-1566(-)
MELQCYLDKECVAYAELQPEQQGTFMDFKTLVEVSSLLACQQEYSQPDDAEADYQAPAISLPINIFQQPTISPQRSDTFSPGDCQPVIQPTTVPPSGEQIVTEKKPRKRGEAAQVRPCQVCGERAGKHSYYGGEVCPSCRAFFRRSVQSGYNNTYCCVRDGSCQVTLKTRKNCQFCRYKLCLAVGMKTTWVLTEEERKQKFAGRGKRKRKSEDQDEENICNSLTGIASCISEEEMLEVKDLVKTSGYFEMSKVNDMETSLIRDIIRMIAFRHPLPVNSQKQLKEVLNKRFRKIAKRLQEFQMLSFKDREEILTQNIPYLVEMQICTIFHPSLVWREQLIPLMGLQEVDKLESKLKSLNIAGLDDLQVPYSHMFTQPQPPDIKQLQETVKEVGGWAQDACETVLISFVLLFCPDMLDLLERRRMEEIQTKFAVLLHKYLNQRHQEELHVSVSRFASGLNLVIKCKEMHQMVAGLEE